MIGNMAESLRKQRELILEESSEQALDRHTSLLEIAIISLYNRLANRLVSGSEAFRAGAAIAAIGSLAAAYRVRPRRFPSFACRPMNLLSKTRGSTRSLIRSSKPDGSLKPSRDR